MRVKIGDTWYDGAEVALCVELSFDDRVNISNMAPECNKYAVFPNRNRTPEQMLDWME